MLKQHQNYPTKSIEQYYLQKQIPEQLIFCQKIYYRAYIFQKQETQKKNKDYYHDNYNIWNNPHQANKKNITFYHQQNIDAKKKIDKQTEEQRELVSQIKKYKMQLYSQERNKRLQQLVLRKQARQDLQYESQQCIEDSFSFDPTHNKSFIKNFVNKQNNPIQGRADHLWNKVHKLSSKHIQNLVNAKVIKAEEQQIQSIQKKIQQDQDISQMKEDLKQQNIKQIQEQFHQQQAKNDQFIQKCGIFRPKKTSMRSQSPHLQTQQTNDGSFVNKIQRGKSAASTTKFVDVHTYYAMQSYQSNISNLAKPKKLSVNYQLMRNPLDRTEYKGLLVTQVDPNLNQIDTEFQKQIVQESQIIQETIQKSQQMRPTTKSSQYTRMRMTQKQSEDKLPTYRKLSNCESLKELDDFDKKMKGKPNKVGFPGVVLEGMKSTQ